MKKFTIRCLAFLVLAALLVGLVPAAFAGETALQADMRRESQDPSFHREFGIFYDESSGYVYVSDSLRNRIIRTKMDGSGWATLGTLGAGSGQFKDPRGIYYDAASGDIYVTDTGNHRIVRTKMDGSGWTAVGSEGSGDSQFYYPRGIWYDPAGEYVYVPDTGNHRIARVKMDGSGWATLGSVGRANGQFLTPRGVQFDPASGLLYVADTGNERIVRCAWDGSGWTTLGSAGRGEKQFREPRGIHYDAATGLLYVADHGNNRIVSTKMDGSEWRTYGSFGNGAGNFYFPRGISLDSATGTAYVADTFNDRIVATGMDGSGWQSLGVRWRPYAWYFAEGTTRGEFSMFLTICNPGETDATVNIQYMLNDGTQIPQTVTVIAHSRYTIDVKQVVGPDKDLSVKVTSEEPVVVERPMYFHYGRRWPGGDVVMGKNMPDNTFYFAEGTTRQGFHTYLCMQNPNPDPANVKVTYMFDGTDPQVQDVIVPPHSRTTIDVNEQVGPDRDVSITVESDLPIMAERPVYFNYHGRITGGHVVIGATEPDTHFYLAEGTTRAGFTTYLCILNPGENAANVTLRYLFSDGQLLEKAVTVEGKSRHTVDVQNDVGGEKDVGIEILSDQPVVVERPMYFVYHGVIVGGHNVIATTDPGTEFLFAEGTTRPGFDEWLCMMNPGDVGASVTMTFMFSDGTTKDQALTVGAHSRATVFVRDIVPAGLDVSVKITSDQPIVVERPMYFNFNGNTQGGSDTMGFSQ
jgi:DNA-binding beta-propeller fold protein YncE